MRYKSVDKNQAEIVSALVKVGASVHITSDVGDGFPDIVVGWRGGNFLLEIKTREGRLNKAQKRWHGRWRGQHAVVRNVDEALAACGIEVVY